VLTRDNQKVIKERVRKSYRIPALDVKLRQFRTRRETKVLEKLALLGIVPQLLFSDNESILETEYIDGKRLSEVLEKEEYAKIAEQIGATIKQIHDKGIIHGDLTTSNMILTNNKLYFIDFGLSFFSEKIEDKAVDLHLLGQALESKHHTISKKMFDIIKKVYGDKDVLNRLEQVEKRGRNKPH
jgi:Kae1-associated kinase Bud32